MDYPKNYRFDFSITIVITLCSLLVSCRSRLDLEIPDKRQVYSVQVGDSDEAELLAQETNLDIIAVSNNTVYFYEPKKEDSDKLKEIGFKLKPEKAQQVIERVVKLNKGSKEFPDEGIAKDLRELKIKVLRKEKEYWAIQGNLEALRNIEEKGYVLEELKMEVRPRNIKIIVPSVEAVQKVNEIGVDIFSTERNPKKNVTAVYGGAYDYQIDLLKEAGYDVEIIPN